MELLIATAILAMALVPVAGYIVSSFTKVSVQKMEATAASFAAEKMNEFLFKEDYDSDLLNVGSGSWSEEELEEGVTVRWKLDVWETTDENGDEISFDFVRVPYHVPCPDGGETHGGEFAAWVGGRPDPMPKDKADRQFDGKIILKTLLFTIQFKGRWETWEELESSGKMELRTRRLVTRRAYLKGKE